MFIMVFNDRADIPNPFSASASRRIGVIDEQDFGNRFMLFFPASVARWVLAFLSIYWQ